MLSFASFAFSAECHFPDNRWAEKNLSKKVTIPYFFRRACGAAEAENRVGSGLRGPAEPE
jgi:hypothetical protein